MCQSALCGCGIRAWRGFDCGGLLLHVAQISFFNDPAGRRPAELLEAWPTVVDVAEAAASASLRVSVIQASSHSESLVRNGVNYHFLPVGWNMGFGALIACLKPDVFHVQGLGFPREVLALAKTAPGTPIFLQDHANRVPRIWGRRLWRQGLSAAAGVSFCAREQARPFIDAKLIQPHTTVYEVPESTSRFTPGDQAEAQRATQIFGDPAVLWVGHLNENKDPLAVLDGIGKAAKYLSGLQLWCCFGAAPLLPEVRDRIARDPQLAGRVHLLGRVPHDRIEKLMRAADFFVSGSHREGSGYSVIEALACGLPPVVTDIPSFRSLTGNGTVGRLWSCGNVQQLSQALLQLAPQPRAALRAAARAQFDNALSFGALGTNLRAAYAHLAAGRG